MGPIRLFLLSVPARLPAFSVERNLLMQLKKWLTRLGKKAKVCLPLRQLRAQQMMDEMEAPKDSPHLLAQPMKGVTEASKQRFEDEATIAGMRQKAEKGEGGAAWTLGTWYHHADKGLAKEAFEWYRRGADLGDARAMASCGFCYEYGRGVKRNSAQAMLFWSQAAAAGSEMGCFALGWAFAHGYSRLPKDTAEAAKWLAKMRKCDAMDASSEARDAARKWLQKQEAEEVADARRAAKKGDGAAAAQLGSWYLHGEKGLAKDAAQGFRWFERGAQLGDATAMNGCGYCLAHSLGDAGMPSLGVAEANRLVRTFYGQAASSGSETGCFNLGFAYAHGRYGLAKDPAKAEGWLESMPGCTLRDARDECRAAASKWLQAHAHQDAHRLEQAQLAAAPRDLNC